MPEAEKPPYVKPGGLTCGKCGDVIEIRDPGDPRPIMDHVASGCPLAAIGNPYTPPPIPPWAVAELATLGDALGQPLPRYALEQADERIVLALSRLRDAAEFLEAGQWRHLAAQFREVIAGAELAHEELTERWEALDEASRSVGAGGNGSGDVDHPLGDRPTDGLEPHECDDWHDGRCSRCGQ